MLRSPIPEVPGPRSKYNPTREGDLIRSIRELSRRFMALVQALGPYQPREILDARGRSYRVLAQDTGTGPIELFNPHPLAVVPTGLPSQIRVYYGEIAGGIPTNFSPGDDPPLLLTVSGSGFIYCPVARDTGSWDLTTGAITSGASVPEDSESMGYRSIASYSVSAGVVSVAQIVSGSQEAQYCGGEWLWGLL